MRAFLVGYLFGCRRGFSARTKVVKTFHRSIRLSFNPSTLYIENKNKGGGSWGCSQQGSILISSIFAFIPPAGVFIFSMNAMMMMMNVFYLDSSQRNIHTFSVDGTLMNEFINISPKLSVIVYVSMMNRFFMTFGG